MCIVVRVTNRCGHVNDHVLMLCQSGKPKSPRIHGTALEDRTNRLGTNASLANLYLDVNRVVLTNNSSISTSRQTNSTADTTSSNHNAPQVGNCDAWTSPYCKTAHIRIEGSGEGYQCMVDGCGQSG